VPEYSTHVEMFSETATLTTSFIIPSSGPHDYIHLQKAIVHIHNYHILMTQANFSYECYELKIGDYEKLA
jgi:hypothetical protein